MPKCREWEKNTQHIPATKYLVLFQSLCKPRLLTPTLPTAPPRRLTQTQLCFPVGIMRPAGQWWAGLGTASQLGYLLNDLGHAVPSASSSASPPPPKGNQPLPFVSSHWRRTDGYNFMLDTRLPLKEAVRAANYFQHAFSLIGNLKNRQWTCSYFLMSCPAPSGPQCCLRPGWH